MKSITSIKDPLIQNAKELATAKGRITANQCLLEGVENIEWALNSEITILHVFFHDKNFDHPLRAKLAAKNIECFSVSDGILKKITDTSYLVPWVGVAQLKPNVLLENRKPSFMVVLDQVKDLGNLGTIVRSATAFGIHHMAITDTTTDLFAKKTIDASRGKVFDITLHRFASPEQTAIELKQMGYQIVATSPHAPKFQSMVQLPKTPIALVLGNETNGVSDELMTLADLIVQIPMASDVESLNVGVAAGISMYELKLKQVLSMMVDHIQTLIGRELSLTLRFIRGLLDIEVKKISNISGQQAIFLMMLHCDQKEKLSLLAQEMEVCDTEIEAWVSHLHAQGLLERCDLENMPAVKITHHGSEFLARIWPIMTSLEHKIYRGFSDHDKKNLVDLLKRLQNNCS